MSAGTAIIRTWGDISDLGRNGGVDNATMIEGICY